MSADMAEPLYAHSSGHGLLAGGHRGTPRSRIDYKLRTLESLPAHRRATPRPAVILPDWRRNSLAVRLAPSAGII